MALSREMLNELSLNEEQIEAVIAAHSETVTGLKNDLKAAEEKAAGLEAVQKELDDAKAALAEAEPFKAQYEQEHAAFEAYKAEIEAEKTLEEKRDLYRTLLANLGIDENRIEAILKITDFADKTVKDGAFENAEALAEAAKAAYLDPVTVQGAEVATPPDNTGARPTREEIMAIADTAERQRAIAENLDIFGA